MGHCEAGGHDLDEPKIEGDFYMFRAGQYAPGVSSEDEDRFVFLCERHKP